MSECVSVFVVLYVGGNEIGVVNLSSDDDDDQRLDGVREVVGDEGVQKEPAREQVVQEERGLADDEAVEYLLDVAAASEILFHDNGFRFESAEGTHKPVEERERAVLLGGEELNDAGVACGEDVRRDVGELVTNLFVLGRLRLYQHIIKTFFESRVFKAV